MAQEPRSVTVKDMPPELWKAIKKAAIDANKGISAFVIETLQKAVNGKGK